MPPIPFPFPIKVGTDICSVQRIFRLLAKGSQGRSNRFVKKILTPRERQNWPKAISTSVERWWMLQDTRTQLSAGIKEYPSRAAHDHGIRARRLAGYRHIPQPWKQTLGASSMRSIEDDVAADIGSLYEGSITGKLETAGTGGDTDAAESEPSNESLIDAVEASISERLVGSVAEDATVDEEAKVTKPSADGEGAETPAAAEIAIGEEAAAITHQQEQKKEGPSISDQLKLVHEEIEEAYPDMWNIAQFLAGRFAAKEAVMKAYETRRLTYQDIQMLKPQLRNGMSQKPITMVIPEDGDWDNAQIVPVSISHDGGFATAVCMAYEVSPDATFETADDVMQAIAGTGMGNGPSNHIRRDESQPDPDLEMKSAFVSRHSTCEQSQPEPEPETETDPDPEVKHVLIPNMSSGASIKDLRKDLQELFGQISSKPFIKFPYAEIQSRNGLLKHAYIHFPTAKDALKAVEIGDNAVLRGKAIRCVLASAKKLHASSPDNEKEGE